jgi:hypothetical protein
MKYQRSPILLQDPSPEHLNAYENLKKAFAPAQDAPGRVWESWTRTNQEQDLEFTRLEKERWNEIDRQMFEEQQEREE